MPSLVTLAQVRAHLQKETGDVAADTVLTDLASRASAACERWTSRTLASLGDTATVKRFAVTGAWVDLSPYDLRAATTVTLHPESASPVVLVADDDYALDPVGATTLGTYTAIRIADDATLTSDYASRFGVALLDVNATWGPTVVPDDVQHACLLTVAAWYRRRIAGSGVVAAYDEPTDTAENLPQDARFMLAPYRRMVVR